MIDPNFKMLTESIRAQRKKLLVARKRFGAGDISDDIEALTEYEKLKKRYLADISEIQNLAAQMMPRAKFEQYTKLLNQVTGEV